MMYQWKKIVVDSMPLLILFMSIEVFAGQTLQHNLNSVLSLPVVLIALPIINGIGGNIGCILGARIASALHVGEIKPVITDNRIREDLLTAIVLGIIVYLFFAIFIYFITRFIKPAMEIDFLRSITLVFLTGCVLVVIVSLISIATAIISFKKGMDPDNAIAPVVTTVGDTTGIVVLVGLLGVLGI
ncbi:MAG TPA: hypothetical protein EYP23_04300 [Thermoplasmata archaeon]|nr:hypothetical protein [Thermoplasmata archaeon]